MAPNPIDFDVVLLEFTRLGETGNVAVLCTIILALLVYLLIVIFVRRADKRDEKKVGDTKRLTAWLKYLDKTLHSPFPSRGRERLLLSFLSLMFIY